MKIRLSFPSTKRKNIDFRLIWEVIKRAQPIADGNNPVCKLFLSVWLKKQGCLNNRS